MSERYVVRKHEAESEQHGVEIWGVYDTDPRRPSWPAFIEGRRIAHFTTDRAKAERDAKWLNSLGRT